MKRTASGWAVRETDLVFPEGVGVKKIFKGHPATGRGGPRGSG